MLKIENIISHCTSCTHCVPVCSTRSNHDYYLVCGFENDNHFLITKYSSTTKILGFQEVDIPDNCPLEDYTETKKE